MKRRLLSALLALTCIASLLPAAAFAAVPDLPDGIFLYEERSSTCTLTSATMMLRTRMYLSGSDNWPSVTQSSVRSVGWSGGLKWSWTYTLNDDSMKVAHEYVSGFTVDGLKALLDEHPEGIVLYCGNLPHAVFLTGYDGDTFYCAETVEYYGSGQIKLSESYLGHRYGSQSAILSRVTAYWYIEEYSINGSACACSEDLAGIYVCTTASGELNIRGGHGTSYPIVGSIPSGAQVTVTKAGTNWAHVEYNGVVGYASMSYLQKVGEIEVHTHSYTAEVTAPTCTKSGYTTYTCSCGDSYVTDEVNPTGHNYVGVVTEPTCAERGYTTYTCVCGLTYKDEFTDPSCPSAKFADVELGSWYHDYVDFMVEQGLMNGTGAATFQPGLEIDRASVVVLLWNMAGRPGNTVKKNPFTDVAAQSWYADAILWAYENGIVNGVSQNQFAPSNSVTREQFSVMLRRFTEVLGYELAAGKSVDLTAYPDCGSVSSWARDGVQWAVDLGLITGRAQGSDVYLVPGGTTTRAEIAVIITRFYQGKCQEEF